VRVSLARWLWPEAMSIVIPWWGKIGAKLVLARLPLGYAVWRRLGLFRHGEMDASEYAMRVFDSHAERSGLTNRLREKTVLELGPGDSIATAIIAAAHGARAIVVDAGRFVRADRAPYLELQRALTQRGLLPPDLSGCRDIDEILDRCNARYLMKGLESLRLIETGSVDLIFSQAVLEHVRRRDFIETMRECRRILRSDGICSHTVDLRDHLGGALNNLRFGDSIWESEFFARSGFYTNRISYTEMQRLFKQAGFEVDVGGVRRWAVLPTPRSRLAREFRNVPEEELRVSEFDVLLRQKN
jgi:SAM-dependent methyltransferase